MKTKAHLIFAAMLMTPLAALYFDVGKAKDQIRDEEPSDR